MSVFTPALAVLYALTWRRPTFVIHLVKISVNVIEIKRRVRAKYINLTLVLHSVSVVCLHILWHI
jgi:hypothetical protein